MELTPEQLPKALTKTLAAVYVLHGDEPLQQQEACDAIRVAAQAKGFSNRRLLVVDAQFDWSQLPMATETLDIFASQTLIDLRIPGGKPGVEGAKTLTAFLKQQDPVRELLLVTLGKLERDAFKSRWYKQLTERAVVVNAKTLTGKALREWLNERARRRGLMLSTEGVRWLAEVCEGNLLAAAQEIDTLHAVHGSGNMSLALLQQEVADHARYTIFQLTDQALAGNRAGVARILTVLRQEGVAEALVLWALTRELRWLNRYHAARQQGCGMQELARQERIPSIHARLLEQAIRRVPTRQAARMLADCAHADRVLKGLACGDIWETLRHIAERLAGLEIHPTQNNESVL
ncbi:MAG: DNA polymerase III subunit delta [Methylococcales bacterium]|nr:DNA polymerase III subunit delta [Methylococcales bacterium]